MSHPVWVCGLKLAIVLVGIIRDIVTPCMGVWIETGQIAACRIGNYVTPCMGVWIETLHQSYRCCPNAGHTLYGCVD